MTQITHKTQFKTPSLTPDLLNIIQNKHTEKPFTGEYVDPKNSGTYLCRQCGLALFRAHDQFHSGCGWPSFDLEIQNHVKKLVDLDGRRTEILCARCDGHLGHIFQGENFTPSNTRHCVNSLSLDWVSDSEILDTQEIILAAGCFWGVEYYLKKLPGVLKTEVGYTGGETPYPHYVEVCHKKTGHLEAVRVVFDPEKLTLNQLLQYFFEIHDPSQANGQGPDIGPQYLSAIFYFDLKQKLMAEKIIKILESMNYSISTLLRPVHIFWPAELYHQDYYFKNNQAPYCHGHTKRF